MIIELPLEKRVKIRELLDKTLIKGMLSFHNLEKFIGVLVAACPAVAYGWLYYKELEILKQNELKIPNFNPNKKVVLSEEAMKDLKWWRSQIDTAKNKIRTSSFDLEIFSDASSTGWGATCGELRANGFWNEQERLKPINYLELKAAFLALKCFAATAFNNQILLRIDNVTALAYINKMGGTKSKDLNKITRQIWEWCIVKGIWIFAEYVASKENPADEGSRVCNLDTEWQLADYAFQKIVDKFGFPSIDLFASRINNKCEKYCSWTRDPDAFAINAMTIDWRNDFWFAFPPFSLITRILKKIRDEGSRGILVVPLWKVQPWFPVFKQLLISEMIVFNPSKHLLLSPCRKISHPLSDNLSLACGIVSGKRSRKRDWTTAQST
ncbi:uncharacterized protein LOC127286759 [Leptopilina boulardi]|uniref:uncharacterized protein LOC127286759 n=1 Tax=Leptopilina boulardi TaxID=63433 RepID=UPI0021F50FBA|nr:uncharacterized protein LOC127286759 [Leptopilina boulardi]